MSSVMQRRWRMLREDILAVLPAWITARVLLGAAYVAAVAVADRLTPGARPVPLTEGLIAWDGTWYRDIATLGYRGIPDEGLRFFPLFPLIGRALSAPFGSGSTVALVVVATVASLVLAVLVRRLMLAEGKSLGVADRAVWFTMLFPSAFVLAWGYAEGLMLVGAVGMFYGLRTKRWWWAAVAGLIAGASRPLGLLLVLPALIEVIRQWRTSDGPERAAGVAAVLSPIAGTAAFLVWVQAEYGNGRLPFTVQSPLRGPGVDPFTRLWESITQLFGPERFGDALHLPAAIALLVLLVFTFRRWPVSYGVYAAATLLIAISSDNLNSLERYGLNAFPIVLTLAVLTGDQRVERPLLTMCAGGFVALASLAWLGAYVP